MMDCDRLIEWKFRYVIHQSVKRFAAQFRPLLEKCCKRSLELLSLIVSVFCLTKGV
jgi:hypothetical protein